VNLMGGDRFPYRDTPVGMGQRVIVIGAGNTAMDCLRVAKRLGAAEVRCVYRRSEAEAPARIEELRHAHEEGIEFSFLHGPAEILLNDDGDVRGFRAQKMTLGEPDSRGRRSPVPLPEFVEWPCETVIYALGTKANPIVGQATRGLALDKRGYIMADDATQATNLPGVFAGGDIVTGGATVILAMAAGRRAARAIKVWLGQGKSKWPVTESDLEPAAEPASSDQPASA
jgi:glutamate synthase (NADPH/NADH) small chain